MTLYADETVQIKVTAKDFNKIALVEDDIAEVLISIYDKELVEVLAATEMTYNETAVGWVYSWDTTDADPGSYRIQIEAIGNTPPNQPYSLEYKRIRLRTRPVGDN